MTIENDEMEHGQYSVCQFFTDPGLVGMEYEYVRQHVSAKEAGEAFKHYINNVATMLGVVNRVIITDGGDCVNAEWRLGEGIVFPPLEN